MTPERFASIDRLFEQALALPPGDRADFLHRECGQDNDLYTEVESLLAADQAAAASIAPARSEPAAAASLPEAQSQQQGVDCGLRLGPYLLVRELGRGGMGAVYQAIRSDGEFLQTVAIKLVKRGMDSESILQRFRAERQILAGLSHPNIANLLDGGTAPDGRPYLVMEYIEGQSLLDYAEERRLDVRARIELFRPICRAVAHAHRHHVLHRDLKPANVMVTSEGTPKLLDFGIAKLLLPELVAGGVPITETDARLMTPDYASPEQIRGEDLTQSTDVYSLGVMLYRILTGKQPYAITGRSVVEIERSIREHTAPLASQAVQDPKARSALTGDLDTIIAMAMRKEPDRRYASAAELEEDLGRFLAGEPVHARPDTFLYRARKWTRRHGVLAASIAGMTFLGALAGGQYLIRRANEVPPEVIDLCRRAETLLRSDIRSTQPGQGLPGPLRESIALWTRATQLAPKHVPAWTGLAGAAEFAIDYDATRKQELQQIASRAAAEALRLDPKSAAAYAVRGALAFRAWRFADAAAEFGKSLQQDPHQPYVVADLADCLGLSGRPGEAIAALENALADSTRGQEGHGPNVRARVVLLNALAGQFRTSGRLMEAGERARQAIQLQGNYAPSRLQLGLILEQVGDFRGAAAEYQAAFTMRPADQRAAAALGYLHAREGRRQEAERMLRHLESLQQEGTPVHGSLALVYAGLGDISKALDALEAAVQGREAGVPYRFFDHRLRDLIGHPRARAMASQIGLPATPGAPTKP
jgi:serine/threonine protein kinase/Flp pilus assembly protein TadD